MFRQDIIYKDKIYTFDEVKTILEKKGYKDIHTIRLLIEDEKLYTQINNEPIKINLDMSI